MVNDFLKAVFGGLLLLFLLTLLFARIKNIFLKFFLWLLIFGFSLAGTIYFSFFEFVCIDQNTSCDDQIRFVSEPLGIFLFSFPFLVLAFIKLKQKTLIVLLLYLSLLFGAEHYGYLHTFRENLVQFSAVKFPGIYKY